MIIRRIQRPLLFSLLVSLTFDAWGQTVSEVFGVQSTLNQLGIDVGRPDGKLEPETMAGLRRYSEIYGGAADLNSVRYVMRSLNEQHRRPVEDEELIAKVESTVRAELLDPESAQFRNLFFVPNQFHSGLRVCGEVNAKNRFGGFVGFQDFAVSVWDLGFVWPDDPWRVSLDKLESESDTSSTGIIDLLCKLSHPPK